MIVNVFYHDDLGEPLTAEVTDRAALETEILITAQNSIRLKMLHGMTPADARAFAAWLLEAADEAETRNLTSEISAAEAAAMLEADNAHLSAVESGPCNA
jgi:hypothetical protein